jgi:hypothetical protein
MADFCSVGLEYGDILDPEMLLTDPLVPVWFSINFS